MHRLGDDCVVYIFSHLSSAFDLLQVSQVCKAFRRLVISSDSLWHALGARCGWFSPLVECDRPHQQQQQIICGYSVFKQSYAFQWDINHYARAKCTLSKSVATGDASKFDTILWSAGDGLVLATQPLAPPFSYYWEVTVLTRSCVRLGLYERHPGGYYNNDLWQVGLGIDSGWGPEAGGLYLRGRKIARVVPYGKDDVVGFLVDMSAAKLCHYYLNGVYRASIPLSGFFSRDVYPAASNGSGSNASCVARFGISPVPAPPSPINILPLMTKGEEYEGDEYEEVS
eukprot:gnl/Spiro4/15635_TR8404_c0_g1_i1.p1 gnl/Spiro4/15635_TR8404_c0_g1~~gnl/Spiro4/15635_TR8404_c0_g1_i1.p1  ORF type:complete len:284 (+),score=34.30 gnl/Spiro4/15635_TR8404_c0_g1_i1:76-927(+)